MFGRILRERLVRRSVLLLALRPLRLHRALRRLAPPERMKIETIRQASPAAIRGVTGSPSTTRPSVAPEKIIDPRQSGTARAIPTMPSEN